ncbi:MAG: hypothetical protein ACR2FX_02565, partial [Chthoniobacterales bacterium]
RCIGQGSSHIQVQFIRKDGGQGANSSPLSVQFLLILLLILQRVFQPNGAKRSCIKTRILPMKIDVSTNWLNRAKTPV